MAVYHVEKCQFWNIEAWRKGFHASDCGCKIRDVVSLSINPFYSKLQLSSCLKVTVEDSGHDSLYLLYQMQANENLAIVNAGNTIKPGGGFRFCVVNCQN